MSAVTGWVFKYPWLIPMLSLWLKWPGTRRMVTSAFVLICAAGLLFIAQPGATDSPPATHLSAFNLASVTPSAAALNTLPALSSAGLYTLLENMNRPVVNQQRKNVSITFNTSWHNFAEFSNHMVQTSLAPQSYRLAWQAPADASQPNQLSIDMQMAPGTYREHDALAMTISAQEPMAVETVKVSSPACRNQPLPEFSVQAVWPSRGYIQITLQQRSQRLALNDLLENSWQLLRIGSESVEFRWYAASPACPQPESITVAI